MCVGLAYSLLYNSASGNSIVRAVNPVTPAQEFVGCVFCLGAMYLAYCRNQGSDVVVWMVIACCCWPCYLIAALIDSYRNGTALCVA